MKLKTKKAKRNYIVSNSELANHHLLILERLEELDRQNLLLFQGIRDIKALIGTGDGQVIPALENAIRRVGKQAVSIDLKVPDKNVPPGCTP